MSVDYEHNWIERCNDDGYDDEAIGPCPYCEIDRLTAENEQLRADCETMAEEVLYLQDTIDDEWRHDVPCTCPACQTAKKYIKERV